MAKALIFSKSKLKQSAIEFLQNGFCTDDSQEQFEISKEMILDVLFDEGNGPDVDEIPADVWKKLSFSPSMKKQIKQLWDEDEEALVLFRY